MSLGPSITVHTPNGAVVLCDGDTLTISDVEPQFVIKAFLTCNNDLDLKMHLVKAKPVSYDSVVCHGVTHEVAARGSSATARILVIGRCGLSMTMDTDFPQDNPVTCLWCISGVLQ